MGFMTLKTIFSKIKRTFYFRNFVIFFVFLLPSLVNYISNMTLYDIIGVKGTCQRGWLSQNLKLSKNLLSPYRFFTKESKLI